MTTDIYLGQCKLCGAELFGDSETHEIYCTGCEYRVKVDPDDSLE